ncbi:MAG: hypothetical protein AAFX87_17880 [Bacteroidota bacterium]
MNNELLSDQELRSIKKSYFNLLALFLHDEYVKSRYVGCMLKWAAQLNLSTEDLQLVQDNFEQIEFEMPNTKVDKVEAIYHLVYMIYLDNVVEDAELEVANAFAQRLGFEPHVVGELFSAIATAPEDGKSHNEVRDEVIEFLKLNELY